MYFRSHDTFNMSYKQSGAALFVALISLSVVTVFGVIALKQAGLDQRITSNYQNRNQAFLAARGVVDNFFFNGVVGDLGTSQGFIRRESTSIGAINAEREINLVMVATGGLCPLVSGEAISNDLTRECYFYDITGRVDTSAVVVRAGFWMTK